MPAGYNDPNDTVNRLRGTPGRSWKSFAGKAGGATAGRNGASGAPSPDRKTEPAIYPTSPYNVNPSTVHPSGNSAFRHPRGKPDAWPLL